MGLKSDKKRYKNTEKKGDQKIVEKFYQKKATVKDETQAK